MTTGNRLLDLQRRQPAYSRMHPRAAGWATPQAATSRELVVLLENGGIDLNLRGLVDAVVDLLPGSSPRQRQHAGGHRRKAPRVAEAGHRRPPRERRAHPEPLQLGPAGALRRGARAPQLDGHLRGAARQVVRGHSRRSRRRRPHPHPRPQRVHRGRQRDRRGTDPRPGHRVRGTAQHPLGVHDELRRREPEPGVARRGCPDQRRHDGRQRAARTHHPLLLDRMEGGADVRHGGDLGLPTHRERHQRGTAQHHRGGAAPVRGVAGSLAGGRVVPGDHRREPSGGGRRRQPHHLLGLAPGTGEHRPVAGPRHHGAADAAPGPDR